MGYHLTSIQSDLLFPAFNLIILIQFVQVPAHRPFVKLVDPLDLPVNRGNLEALASLLPINIEEVDYQGLGKIFLVVPWVIAQLTLLFGLWERLSNDFV